MTTKPTEEEKEYHWTILEEYLRGLCSDDFTQLSPGRERESVRTSTGSAFTVTLSADFDAVETHADILTALDRGHRSEVIRLFRRLQRLIGFAPFSLPRA